MAMHYTDTSRENDPHALPDIEVFYMSASDFAANGWLNDDGTPFDARAEDFEPGWYWWPCLPGCLPDSEPMGPFATEAEALADARDGYEQPDATIEP